MALLAEVPPAIRRASRALGSPLKAGGVGAVVACVGVSSVAVSGPGCELNNLLSGSERSNEVKAALALRGLFLGRWVVY